LVDPRALPSAAARLAQAGADGESVREACRTLMARGASTAAAFAELAAEAGRAGLPLAVVARGVLASQTDGHGAARLP